MLNSILKKIFFYPKFILTHGFKYLYISYYEKIQGWLTVDQAKLIADLATDYSSKNGQGKIFVEIGSWKGKSSFIIAKSIGVNDKLYCIDPFNADGEEFFKKNYKEFESALKRTLLDEFKENMRNGNVIDKVIPLKGYSQEIAQTFNEKIDFLFIDGNHNYEYVERDIMQYSQKIKHGGLILFHDVDVNPAKINDDHWKTKNSLNLIIEPALAISKHIESSNQWFGKTCKHGMYYAIKN